MLGDDILMMESLRAMGNRRVHDLPLKTAKDLLVCARELISDPARWTKGSYATDASGDYTQISNENACRFCAVGAIYRCGYEVVENRIKVENQARRLMWEIVGERNLASFNDHPSTTHAMVLDAFDRAIVKAGATT